MNDRIKITVEPWSADSSQWMWILTQDSGPYMHVIKSGRALTKDEAIRQARVAADKEKEKREQRKRDETYREANRFEEYV